jgi:hypothetical protein
MVLLIGLALLLLFQDHKGVKITLEELVLDHAIFFKLALGVLFRDYCRKAVARFEFTRYPTAMIASRL